jgi:hypothetical protein
MLYLLGIIFTFIVLNVLPEDEKLDVKPFDHITGYAILSVIWPVTLIALGIRELRDCF